MEYPAKDHRPNVGLEMGLQIVNKTWNVLGQRIKKVIKILLNNTIKNGNTDKMD